MRPLIAAALIGASLAALAACNKPTPGAANAAPGAAQTAASGPLTAAQMPHRKPGLWKQVMTMDAAAPAGPGMQLCVDEASEAKMSAFAQRMPGGGAHCPPAQYTRNIDGSISFSESCDMGANGKTSSTGVIKGDFNSGFTEDIDVHYSGSPAPSMNGDHKMTITSTWTGPCAPGQKGGDLILANGMKRNILDDEAAKSGAPQ